jgi:hypothetical protein
MHTETEPQEGPNGNEAVQWLWKEWASVLRLPQRRLSRRSASPGTSLTDQVDWDTALREQNGNVNPLGLYDLDRNIRAVGKAYKQLIKDWGEVLPTSSVCLSVPIVKPSQADRMYALRQQAVAAAANDQLVGNPANPEVG